jgi:hypothetical protein
MVKKLEFLPFAGRLVRDLNGRAKKLGYQKTMREILKMTGSKIEVINKNHKLKLIFKKEPLIVVANHPAMTDVITLVAAQEPREDSFLIISSNFLGMLSNLDKHLIPVYINHRLLDKEDKFNGLIKLFRKFHWSKNYSRKISHQKNIDSIKRAASIVKNGGMVSMYPGGGGGKNGEWFSGIGYLISGAIANKGTKVVMAYIEGTSIWDYVRLIPGGSVFMPKCRVTFSTEESIINYYGMEPKDITERLRDRYNQWTETLPKQGKWWTRIVNKIPSVPENAYYFARCMVLWIMTRTMS